MKKEILCRPFGPEQVKSRQGQHGKTLSYIETHAVIARLNEGCDAWSFEIVKHEIVEDEVIVVGKLVADGIVKMAFGGATITRDREGHLVDLGDTHKAAASDALKKAASLIGVGLELYGGSSATAPVEPKKNNVVAPAIEDRLTARQLAAIHAASRRRGLSPQRLTAMLVERCGRGEPQHLTKKQASDVITELSVTNGAHA